MESGVDKREVCGVCVSARTHARTLFSRSAFSTVAFACLRIRITASGMCTKKKACAWLDGAHEIAVAWNSHTTHGSGHSAR
jgi:hypothetical protein